MKGIKQQRGQLTDRVQQAAEKFLNRKITVRELRLMPYLQNIMVNNQKLDYDKVNLEEIDIYHQWQYEGYLIVTAEKIMLTKKFWDIINELIYLSYVDLY